MKRRIIFVFIVCFCISPQIFASGERTDSGWLELQALGEDTLEYGRRFSGGAFAFKESKTGSIRKYERIGFIALVKFDNDDKSDYIGVESTKGIQFGNRLSLFFGTGLIAGETDICSDYDEENKLCEENFVFGIAPELGIRLKPSKNIFVSIFKRKYYLTEEIEDFSGTGINLGIRF